MTRIGCAFVALLVLQLADATQLTVSSDVSMSTNTDVTMSASDKDVTMTMSAKTDMSMELGMMKIETVADNVHAVGQCKLIPVDACEDFDANRETVMAEHGAEFVEGTLFSCAVGYVCSQSGTVSRTPCADDDAAAMSVCLPLNRYRCMVGEDGTPSETCNALTKQQQMGAEFARRREAIAAIEAANLRMEHEAEALKLAAADNRQHLPASLEDISVGELQDMESWDLTVEDRFALLNMRRQLLEQNFYCMSTCVACVTPGYQNLAHATVERTVLIERAKSMYDGVKVAAATSVGALLAGMLTGYTTARQEWHRGLEDWAPLTGLANGITKGSRQALRGGKMGARLGARYTFHQCQATGAVVNHGTNDYSQDNTYSRHTGTFSKLAQDTQADGWSTPIEYRATAACTKMDSKKYNPQLLHECAAHKKLCGASAIAIPLPISSGEQCQAVANDPSEAHLQLRAFDPLFAEQ